MTSFGIYLRFKAILLILLLRITAGLIITHSKCVLYRGSTRFVMCPTAIEPLNAAITTTAGSKTILANSKFPRSFLGLLFQVLQKFESDKEESRRLRRTVFSSSDWKKHRSSSRYFRELINMPRSRVLRGLIKQALLVSLCSSVLVLYNVLIELKILSSRLPLLTFPSLPFTLTSSSLGLLLVFRTNTAYARWKDARNYWSYVSAKSFDVMRQSAGWLDSKASVAKIVRYLVAFSKCLKWHVTHRNNIRRLQEELTGVLSEDEVAEVLASRLKPQFVLLRLTQYLASLNLVPNVQSHMDRGLIELSMALENCDRIYTTPIPLVYTRMTARFLLLWLITFPMSLYNEFSLAKKWVVPFIIFMNSILLLGIDDLGVQIEEPFSILPLANIVYNIQLTGQMVLQDCKIDWFHGVPAAVTNSSSGGDDGNQPQKSSISKSFIIVPTPIYDDSTGILDAD